MKLNVMRYAIEVVLNFHPLLCFSMHDGCTGLMVGEDQGVGNDHVLSPPRSKHN